MSAHPSRNLDLNSEDDASRLVTQTPSFQIANTSKILTDQDDDGGGGGEDLIGAQTLECCSSLMNKDGSLEINIPIASEKEDLPTHPQAAAADARSLLLLLQENENPLAAAQPTVSQITTEPKQNITDTTVNSHLKGPELLPKVTHAADTSTCTIIIQPLEQDNSFSELNLSLDKHPQIELQGCSTTITGSLVDKTGGNGVGLQPIRDHVTEINNTSVENPPTFLVTTLRVEAEVLGGSTDSFPNEDTCMAYVKQDESFQAFDPVANQIRVSAPIYVLSGQSQASTSCASQHDGDDERDSVPLYVSVAPSVDMNAFLEINVTKGHASEEEKQEGGIQLVKGDHATVINQVLPEKIQDVGECGGAMEGNCEVLELEDKVVESNALDWKPSYVDYKQILEAEVLDGGFESLPNGGRNHKEETSVEDIEQEMVVQSAETILHEVAGNEKMEPHPVSSSLKERVSSVPDSNSAIEVVVESQVTDACAFQCAEIETVLVQTTESSGYANPDSQFLVTEDCVSPSHEYQNRDTHVSEISTTEERIQTIVVGGEAELAGGLSTLTENQIKVRGNEHITGTEVEDLDSFPCTGRNSKTGVEFIKDMSPSEESYDKVAKAKEIGDVLRSSLLVDLQEKSVDSVREVGLDRSQNFPNAEPVTRFDLDMLKLEISSEREHATGYTLEPEKEGEFSVSDLVWGKVKSHPWWPGQIFDSSDASERAMKYKKRDSFLVAYFGDKTFAWNDASSLNHFRTHFSQMERQSNSEAFHTAVDYALDEVRRRVELGMVCSCTPKEDRVKLSSQITENAGIRVEARKMDGLNNSTSVTFFNSGKLLQYIKALAPYPCGGGDRLELKIAQAQLLAFYRLKGYCRLPEFHVYGGLLEDDVTSSLSGERNLSQEVIEHEPPVSLNDEHMLSNKAKLKARDSSSRKRKYGSDGGLHPRRKQRSLSDLMAGKRAPSCLVNGGKKGVERDSSKSASSSVKKRKAVDSFSEDSAVKSMKRRPSFSRDVDTESPTPQSFKVGECIRRIASQLTGSPPILKCSGESFQKSAAKLDRGNENDVIDGSPYVPEGSHRRSTFPKEYSFPDEMLSQLCLAARDPMKGYSFLTTIVGFFSEFRNSISLECSSSWKHKWSVKIGGGKTGIGISKPFNTENSSNKTFDFEEMSDSYWTDRIIQSSPEEEPSRRIRRRKREAQLGIHTGLDTSSFEAEDPLQLSLFLDFEEQNLDDDYVPLKEKPSRKYRKRKKKSQLALPGDKDAVLDFRFPSLGDRVNRSNENMEVNDFSPTALLMSFTKSESIPSEMNLNKIFRRFGPLKESETEVLRDTSSARVVFKKQTDAEVALSSAAKFSIFGPVHVNYQLRFKV